MHTVPKKRHEVMNHISLNSQYFSGGRISLRAFIDMIGQFSSNTCEVLLGLTCNRLIYYLMC